MKWHIFMRRRLSCEEGREKLSDYNELEIDGNFYIIGTDREEEITEDE